MSTRPWRVGEDKTERQKRWAPPPRKKKTKPKNPQNKHVPSPHLPPPNKEKSGLASFPVTERLPFHLFTIFLHLRVMQLKEMNDVQNFVLSFSSTVFDNCNKQENKTELV